MATAEHHLLCKIYKGSHFFKILRPNPRMIEILLRFAAKYVQYNTFNNNNNASERYSRFKKANEKPQYKIYASKTLDRREFRFHIGQWEDFMHFLDLNVVQPREYTIDYIPDHEIQTVEWKFSSKYELYDYQKESHQFIVTPRVDKNRSRLVAIYTGGGKTVVASSALGEIKERTVIIVMPTYIDKWISDVQNLLGLKGKEIMVVQGSKDLGNLVAYSSDPAFQSKIIIISLRTLQQYHKFYESESIEETIDKYGCAPENLYKTLKVGTVLYDEVHQSLHAVFKTLLYTNVKKVIALSATFTTMDPFVEEIQKLMFPANIRFDKVKMQKYIKVYPIAYQFADMYKRRIETTERGSSVYSHVAFERSILKMTNNKTSYLDLINYVLQLGYVTNFEKNDKCIIFAASIAMCNEIVQYLTIRYPSYKINRYVEEDPYENVLTGDVIVSTILSAGTALDIPNLRVTIQTNNILSPVSNLQALGRLRQLKDRDVKYYYLYCEDIPKHKDYHLKRQELYADRVASIKNFRYPYML